MGITILPDWGKGLGQALGEAGKGISEMIDPLLDFHTKFAQEAAANPQMVENMAGHAFVNDGDLGVAEKFIPKKILADIKERASKGNVPPEFLKRKAGIDVSRMKRTSTTGDVTPEEIATLKPIGGFSNQEWYDLGKSAIAGESIEGAARGFAGAPIAKPLAAGELAKSNLSLVMDKLKGEELQSYIQYRASLPASDRQTLDGLDVSEALRFQARIKADREMMQARNAEEFARWSKEADLRMGTWWSEHTGGGDPEDWMRWLHDPKLRDKVHSDIASGQMDDEDRQFSEINRLYQARDARMNSLEMSRLNNLIQGTTDRINGNAKKGIRPADEFMRGEMLTRLNLDLSHYAETTKSKPMQAFYGNLYQLKKKPIGEPEDREKLQKNLPYQDYLHKVREQDRAKENRLHFVANPFTKDAKEVDPNDVSDMLQSDTQGASSQIPTQPAQQPVTATTVEPPRPATSEDIINAARARYIQVRDTLLKTGMKPEDARKRAAFVTDSIFNTQLSK